VISAIKIYEESGKSCAYLDLDGHFGNSIEDTRSFNPLLNKAIPEGCNYNPSGRNETYLSCFEENLKSLESLIMEDKIHYVIFAHGADSHDQDDLGGSNNTEYWVKCAEVFANWVNEVSNAKKQPLPVVLALFGGYRKDNYDAVLNLHIKSLIKCSNIICGNNFEDDLEVPLKQ
jgi:acetoin utilization deacetylase AcuC-like enzyme